MRKLLLLFLISSFNLLGQCPVGHITVGNQSSLDQLLVDYPNCTHITGNLTLSYYASFSDQTFFSKIDVIDGDLFIGGNGLYPDFTSLDTVYGNITLAASPSSFPSIQDLNFFSSLQYVGGDFNLGQSKELTDCSVICNLLTTNAIQGVFSSSPHSAAPCSSIEFIQGSCGIIDCPPGDLQIMTASQADAFDDIFSTCTEINGDLSVSVDVPYFVTPPVSLDGLSQITKINGSLNLTVEGSGPGVHFWQGDASGLSNVEIVGGNVLIKNINSIPKVTQYNNSVYFAEGTFLPDTVAGSFHMSGGEAPNLKFVGSLVDYLGNSIPQLQTIEWEFTVRVPYVKTVDLPSLVYIGGGNNGLAYLNNYSGFGQLETIAGDFYASYKVSDFSGLEKLKSVGGDLTINSLPVSSIDELGALENVGGTLKIENNANLVNLNGLSSLEAVGANLVITSNYGLNDCHGICNLLENDGVTGGVVISANPSDCSSQSEVITTCTTDSLIVENQNDANNFATAHPGATANGDLIIGSLQSYVSGLSNLNGLNQLTKVTGSLIISHTADLSTLNGLHNITSIGKDLILSNNLKIVDLQALSSLIYVGGSIIISNNAKLTNVNGLGLSTVGNFFGPLGPSDDLIIKNNPSLVHVDGLSNLTKVGGDLNVSGNVVLVDCDGLCALLQNSGVNGSIIIENNPSSCSNEVEVTNGCVVAIEDIQNDGLVVYPNPVQHSFSLVGKSPIQGFTVYNSQGQQVLRQKYNGGQIVISDFPKGLYLLKIKMGNLWAFRKIVFE